MRALPFVPHRPLIKSDTSDAVLEWHVVSDNLYLSRGAQRMLGMEDNPPESMFTFLSACHEEKRELLQQSLQTFVEGHIGAHVELCFPINGILARTQLVTLTRDHQGKAERIIGCISAIDRQSPGLLPSARFSIQQTSTAHTTQDHARLMLALNASGDGLWDWDAVTNMVYYSPRYIGDAGLHARNFPRLAELVGRKNSPRRPRSRGSHAKRHYCLARARRYL